MATPPVGAGAPPVDCEGETEAEAELELASEEEAEPEVVLVEEELEVVLTAEEAVWLAVLLAATALEPVSEALPAAVWEALLRAVSETLAAVAEAPIISSSKLEVAQALTLLGSSLYQAG
jgi:hypothetical protein